MKEPVFDLLMCHSAKFDNALPLVGCTGDQSFSKAVGMGLIPLDQMVNHKQDFILSLSDVSLAMELKTLSSYFRNIYHKSFYQIRARDRWLEYFLNFLNINRDGIVKEYRSFLEILHREYRFNDRVINDVFRYVLLKNHPKLVQVEELAINDAINQLRRESKDLK